VKRRGFIGALLGLPAAAVAAKAAVSTPEIVPTTEFTSKVVAVSDEPEAVLALCDVNESTLAALLNRFENGVICINE
jgi:hypothetical protein